MGVTESPLACPPGATELSRVVINSDAETGHRATRSASNPDGRFPKR